MSQWRIVERRSEECKAARGVVNARAMADLSSRRISDMLQYPEDGSTVCGRTNPELILDKTMQNVAD